MVNTSRNTRRDPTWPRALLFSCLLVFTVNPVRGQNGITILDTAKDVPYERTNIDAGPAHGDILNWHYFPALNFYRKGRYHGAKNELEYVIERPTYLKMNPRQGEFLSNSHYLRGMVYFYHAVGAGKLVLAKRDFEQAIKWNPKNYLAHLELARVWSAVGLNQNSAAVLARLLEMKPDDKVAEEAKKELSHLQAKREE